jgi:hypothetical protein
MFSGISGHYSIDASPPDASLKAANNIPLAAFFFGNSIPCINKNSSLNFCQIISIRLFPSIY